MTDRLFAIAGDWAVSSDGIQWILQRRWRNGRWEPLSFVRSSRDILARCMREKGVEAGTVAQLLAGLPQHPRPMESEPRVPGAASRRRGIGAYAALVELVCYALKPLRFGQRFDHLIDGIEATQEPGNGFRALVIPLLLFEQLKRLQRR